MVLSLLEDTSGNLRCTVHTVLGSIALTSPACLYQAIKALQDNIRRRPLPRSPAPPTLTRNAYCPVVPLHLLFPPP